MSDHDAIRTRREPPPFRSLQVTAVSERTPRLRRITLGGPALAGFDPGLPAASVRLLVPTRGDLELPAWTGNEFLLADGTRPAIRTLTPLDHRPERHELDVEVVLHGDGPLSTWAGATRPGDEVAMSGPGRGHEVDPSASEHLLAGDESALPAIGVLLAAIGGGAAVHVLVEVEGPEARLDLDGATSARWLVRSAGQAPGDALVEAVTETEVSAGTRVWAAGEAAAMQRLRRLLLEERSMDRRHATIRGYWKVGRASGGA